LDSISGAFTSCSSFHWIQSGDAAAAGAQGELHPVAPFDGSFPALPGVVTAAKNKVQIILVVFFMVQTFTGKTATALYFGTAKLGMW